MDAAASFRSPARCLAGAVAIGAMWWVSFENGEPIPILTYVNFGIHEAGQFLSDSFSDVMTTLMGSIAQVGVPLALAGYFFFFRNDWFAAGMCLAWGATSAHEVSLYIADARVRELDLIAGSHDWAFILGPEGYDAIDKAAPLAERVRDYASVALFAGLVLCLVAPFRGSGAELSSGRPRPAA